MRITLPQRRRWTGWRHSSKPPFLLRFYYFSTPNEAPKCHDMRGIFRNAKCRKCLIFQAIPTFAKWCQDNQKIGKTFINEKLETTIRGQINSDCFLGRSNARRSGFHRIEIVLHIACDADEAQIIRWREQLEKRCPVLDNLLHPTQVDISYERENL